MVASPIQRTHVIVHVSIILRILIPHFLTMDHMYTSALREALYKVLVRSNVRWDGGAIFPRKPYQNNRENGPPGAQMTRVWHVTVG